VNALRTVVDDRDGATVGVLDRAVQYGHGVFETIRIVRGAPQLWDFHWDRLRGGCIRLGIDLERDRAERILADLLAGVQTGTIKLIATAGESERGYRFDAPARARCIAMLFPPTSPTGRNGVTARVCMTRLAPQPALAGIKHLNRLEQVLARREWIDPSIAEGLMLDVDGNLISGVQTNVFVVHGARILTPALQRCGVAGVMRRHVLDRRPGCGGCDIVVGDVTLAMLHDADECFVTNSLIGVWPVTRILTADGEWRRTIGTISRRIVDTVDDELAFRAEG
jgi:4-amino-4-deoxychorismate lyase